MAVLPFTWLPFRVSVLPGLEGGESMKSPLAIPPPTKPIAVLPLTWLTLRATLPRMFTMPPPPRLLELAGPAVCLLPVTRLKFRVSVSCGYTVKAAVR